MRPPSKLLLDNTCSADVSIGTRNGELSAFYNHENMQQLFVIHGALEPEDFSGLQRLLYEGI
jgi:hypothetical protein